MTGEDKKDLSLDTEKAKEPEWKPNFWRDFRLSKKKSFLTIRCPQWVTDEIDGYKQEHATIHLNFLVEVGEPIQIELINSLPIPQAVRLKMIDQIKGQNTTKAVAEGDKIADSLIKIKLSMSSTTSFAEEIRWLKDTYGEESETYHQREFLVVKRFRVINDLIHGGKFRLVAAEENSKS